MEKRWVNALVKTIIFLVIVHVIFLGLGYFFKTDVGIFNLYMVWAHWSDGWINATIGIAATIITYFVIYFCFTHDETKNIEDN